MNEMVKIVRSGEEQSVPLPEGYRFDTDDVRITRLGHRIVIEPGGEIDEETGLPLATLRALIQEGEVLHQHVHDLNQAPALGLDSGPSEPWDAEAIKREARARRGW